MGLSDEMDAKLAPLQICGLNQHPYPINVHQVEALACPPFSMKKSQLLLLISISSRENQVNVGGDNEWGTGFCIWLAWYPLRVPGQLAIL